ncbi:MAG: hypothetical protein JOZ04_03315 [Acidimicrobiia bacterium]|nr:hypothetical protein [Acidimicrobiia bacterium]
MKTHQTHQPHHRSTHAVSTHAVSAAGSSPREDALRWLAQQLRWERKLAELRDPTSVADEEEAA